VCLDLRGTPPTPVEAGYFAADADPSKRRKVVDWLVTDEAVKAFLAGKLGIPADRVRTISLRIDLALERAPRSPRPAPFGAVGADGVAGAVESFAITTTPDAGVNGRIALDEAYPNPVDPPAAGAWWVELTNRAADPAPMYNLVRRQRLDPPPAQTYPLVVPPASGFSRINVWVADEEQVGLPSEVQVWQHLAQNSVTLTTADTDAEFLRRAVQSARGTAPSAVEERYFAEDKDPEKREKLLDLLLKDPAVAKKLGDDWKKKMLEPESAAVVWGHLPSYFRRAEVQRYIMTDGAVRLWDLNQKPQPGRLEKVVGELVGAKKTDEQVLDGVSLVVLGRLPTESEKRLTLATIGKAADRTAAWVEVARALSATEEAKKHTAELNEATPAPAQPPEKK
jgi:hypothetical protein